MTREELERQLRKTTPGSPEEKATRQALKDLKRQAQQEPVSQQKNPDSAPQVFLCYAHEDWETAKRLYDDLQRTEFRPWMDSEDLRAGQRWRNVIKRTIKESQYVLMLLSVQSIPKRGFVQKEMRQALAVVEELPSDEVFLIPLRLDACEPQEELLQELHRIDLFPSYEHGFQRLLRDMREVGSGQKTVSGEQAPRGNPHTLETSPQNPEPAPSLPLQEFSFKTVTVDAKGNIVTQGQNSAQQYIEDLGNGVTLEMVFVPGGTFLMGSPESEKGRESEEGPQHQVTISPFLMGKYLVTQEQWIVIMGENPSYFPGAKRPVEMVSWDSVQEFCQRISEKTGAEYRLPTEAEWEYACRAGTTTPFSFGKTITTTLANYDGNQAPYALGPKGICREETSEVGSFPPNAFGLYDMHGNVWEWCIDWFDGKYYQQSPAENPCGPVSGSVRVLRGGGWNGTARGCRSARRPWLDPINRYNVAGFRLVSMLSL